MKSRTGPNEKIRNLDELQEADVDTSGRGSRLGALVVTSLGGVCIVLAAAAFLQKPSKPSESEVDPLGALVERSKSAGASASSRLDVTFPSLLSSSRKPTTAYEAVRDGKSAPAPAAEDESFQLPPGHPDAPPPAADRLPVMPLPAQHVLADAGKETTTGHDDVLTTVARHASRESGTEVEPGGAGGFQLQVSSFKEDKEAQAFAAALRRRGHRAYVEAANVKGRGLWHRVRIGPFKYKRSADTYRQEFEAKERMVTFVIAPQKTTVRVAQRGDEAESE
jgi:DedD protein